MGNQEKRERQIQKYRRRVKRIVKAHEKALVKEFGQDHYDKVIVGKANRREYMALTSHARSLTEKAEKPEVPRVVAEPKPEPVDSRSSRPNND